MTTSPKLKELVQLLKKESSSSQAPIWKRIAKDLSKPTRQRRVVNLSRVARHTKPDETVIIPGKLLGAGNLPHKLTIAAYAFSRSALDRINQSKGKAMTIEELLKQKPKTQNIKIIG